nr:IS66 family transposase [Myxococcus sp. CA039A]
MAFCWAHVRRKCFEARQFAPACDEVLELMGQLYVIEADLPEWCALSKEERPAVLAQRRATRQQHSAPVVERTLQWALAKRCEALKRGPSDGTTCATPTAATLP